jgi:sec-independent protein translocase protein TatC
VTTYNDESDLEASRAPLLEHLNELRSRLIVCVAALALGFVLCFAFAEPILLFLLKPFEIAGAFYEAKRAGIGHGPFDLVGAVLGLRDTPRVDGDSVSVIATGVLETLFTKMKMAGFGAVVLCFPVLAWQLYRFVAPGLYRRERKAFIPFLLAAPFLFLLGAGLVYYVMLPFVLWFSLSQQAFGEGSASVQLLPKISEYLSLVTSLLLAFGLCFQLPVVVSLLGLSGVVSAEALVKGRRYAIVGVVVLAAIVTPPDPISQLMLAVPLVLLYEVSIWCVRLIELRRPKAEPATA